MGSAGLTFELPIALYASEPPEARGLRRDEVRLIVSQPDGAIDHQYFFDLPAILRDGDLLVVNTSGTLSASLPAERPRMETVELHLSTELPGGLRTVEVRQITDAGSRPLAAALAGETLHLPAGGRATLLAPYPFAGHLRTASRLWAAVLELPVPLPIYLDRFGAPIRYAHVPKPWPSEDYQTIFAAEKGSAEMPSAGRPFTREVIDRLRRTGVRLAPLTLHTGVSSLEDHEAPYEERLHVPRETADAVNAARAAGGRVIAVGTTVVRALETVTDDLGLAHPGDGWTNLVIAADDRVRSVDGLLTGLHEPRATHLSMLRAIAGRDDERLDRAYGEAIAAGYLWHEFGDVHLILRRR